MEQIVELNHSLLSKLPLEVQNLLKLLPLSDFSIVLTVVMGLVVISYLLFGCNSASQYEPFDFGEYKREKKEVLVKVNTPNPKKNLKRGKKKKEATPEEPKEERKVFVGEEGETKEEGWEIVKAKKIKKKED
jgi:hypothetical protein